MLATLLRRVPFTLLLQLAVLGLALALGAFDDERGAELARRHGFGVPSLRAGRLDALLTSTLLVESFGQWVRIALLLVWSLGALEWLAGTRAALAVYWATNLVSQVLTALAVVLLAHADVGFARDAVELRDVGASAGAFGCAGALLARVPARHRAAAMLTAAGYLGLKPLLAPSALADASHAIALALGLVLALRVGRAPG